MSGPIGNPADALRREVDLAHAAELARLGEHEQAIAMLCGLEAATGPSRDQLDLLARVRAQHGDLDAADATWQRVLAEDEADADALAGRALIAELISGRRKRRLVPVLAMLGAAVVVAGSVVWFSTSGQTEPPAAQPPTARAESPDAADNRQGLREAQDRIQELESRLAARDEDRVRTATELGPLTSRVTGPEVRAGVRGAAIRVVFREGLFLPDSTEPSAAGQQTLIRFGERLTGARLRVGVLGHTLAVPGGANRGGSAVALARAASAAEQLAQASGLPLTSFTVRSADQRQSPFPASDEQGRERSRTVTVFVRPG